MLLMYLCDLSGGKSFRNSNQCRPKPAMHESDLPIYQTANEHIVRIGYCLEDGENLMVLRMGPPASLNRLVDNRLSQPRNGAFGRREDNAVFVDERDGFSGSHIGSTVVAA